MELLRCEGIKKVYGRNESRIEVLRGVSFSVERGELTAVVGALGSGKSTFLNILGSIDRPSEGEVYLNDSPISNLGRTESAILRRREIGIVYQFFNLIPDLTIRENILLPLMLDHKKPGQSLFDMLVEKLGLKEKLKKFPWELSGGQQQRASMARALLYKPSLLLADEPTGNLDSQNSEEIMELMESFNRELSQTILFVTHSHELLERANRVIELSDGRIVSDQRKDQGL